ncbi:U6 snRNA-associated Sm-like protein LSm1 [Neolecta irregularis DAH-3]|uniref:U6 snRNA-associated Sm-like protein LSm1 n=1 Tax=Neolecta irregularis (strain DAH-3) TaxID=1198029 RepID=A0A1U7LVT7_NEOID|nr:U6 snRNA-associated Sm-like protein LSm1 [Neolecta irregularis DAH-3]|eukprot:OLL26790.1 U6 snRNA-associated Sm-like protein LSm1 [Neolecta irregularis DAH-3]
MSSPEISDPALLTFFTTSGSLLDCVDKRLIIVLRDGKTLLGVLRSYDQYANLVLQDTIERLYTETTYADIAKGIYLIRGENVVLLGELVRLSPGTNLLSQDLLKPDEILPKLRRINPKEALAIQNRDQATKARIEKKRNRILASMGFSVDHIEGDDYLLK